MTKFFTGITLVFLVLFILASCGVPPIEPQPTPSLSATNSPSPQPIETETPLPDPPLDVQQPEIIEQYNFLLLGGDWREHRRWTQWGNKTDVMLLVQITMSDPVQIRVIQFPRNLYHPVDAFPDMWLFSIYGKEDMVGLHYYFQQVFDVDLQGIAYIHMDNFEKFVNDLGGIHYGATVHSGAETLKYLRDNDNNWGCAAYDCANRQFEVLKALAERIKTQFYENAYVTTGLLIDSYGYLFDTDLSAFEQIHWLVELGWSIAMSDYEIEFDKVTASGVIYNDTPLNVRGWTIPDLGKMQEWMR
jgi:anionic cell wall polymer biosynthesis LytR-Cps2A-Psr (LCP) family protein